MNAVDGKVALVTGGGRGIGEAIVRALVREGAVVVVSDVLDEPAAALADELGQTFLHHDVTDPVSWRSTVDAVMAAHGRLDVLVNNAGIATSASVRSQELDEWNRVLEVNLTGTFLGIQAAARVMREQGSGSIVNLSSVDGLRGNAALHAYTASKFGVTGITKSTGIELGRFGIRVNSVHPGFIRTAMTAHLDPAAFGIPLARAGTSEDVAEMVVFLASDASGYSTASEFVVDGGITASLPHTTAG
ncbi:SDR family oxidoreductase [Protaetiibacter mangrovi]|uniref:SDR family oxidoreductase n=1 Tax=Protaetiibacter mangrovi TaxID=2970926 RepID=A0ABT1ZFR5_9MICO|nr:SDR family oxidoreductase [Protaetiibacter mangrovi]MCS0499553.1 SDR family oxidoreductase [Protaetiibacter mangrovi]TPX04573.1 SDR family oxidoreductase [Schumannella luteola]